MKRSRTVKQEEVNSLLELVSKNFQKVVACHSNLLDQAQSLKNRQLFGKEETLQEVIEQLLEQEKLLKELCEQRESIQFLAQTKLPWSVKQKIIIPLLSEYGWSPRNKLQIVFQTINNRLLKLEKQLAELSYFSFDSADFNFANFLEQFTQDNFNNRVLETGVIG